MPTFSRLALTFAAHAAVLTVAVTDEASQVRLDDVVGDGLQLPIKLPASPL